MDVVKIVRVVFGAVAVVLLVGAVIVVQHTRSFLAESVSARGTVQELVPRTSTDSNGRSSSTFAPVVRFTTADGRVVTFVSSTSSYPPAYEIGETVDVLYTASDPQRARLHDWFSLWGAAAILGGLGTVFGAVSGGLTVAAVRGRRARPVRVASGVARFGAAADGSDDEADDGSDDEPDDDSGALSDPGLRRTGVRVQADVQRVRPTHTYAANGSAIYRIVAQWLDPDRHEVRIFTSDEIPFDPTPYLTAKTVDVYIAPDDPARHYVDISFLPRAASGP